MTDHIDVPIVGTGDWIDAAWINQYLGDNVRAWRQAYSANGMIAYAVDANTLAGLAKPASLGLLTNDAAGALAWVIGGQAYQHLRKNLANNGVEFGNNGIAVTHHHNTTGHSYNSATWRDMPNSSKSITLDVQSTIICIGYVSEYATDSPNFYGFFDSYFNIDGVDISGMKLSVSYAGDNTPKMVLGYKVGVAAGSRTIKLRESCGSGSYSVTMLEYMIITIPDA